MKMGDEVQHYYLSAVEVAKEAGERVKADFYRNKTVEVKENFADLVTETDQAVEKMIMTRLAATYPGHKFIGEETVSGGGACHLGDDPTWIIDPVDGTTNFVHGIPHTSISIGLAVNKEIVVGVVHCPILEEMFTAMKGHGAFCNDQRITVSNIQDLKQSAVIVEGGTSRVRNILDAKVQNIKSIIQNCHGIRAYGSAAIDMCMVARGCAQAYMEHGIHVWDIAAGTLIVREAGGVVVDPSGEYIDLFNRRVLAACNPVVAKQLSSVIINIDMERD